MNALRTWYRERLPVRIAALEAAREELDRSGAEAVGSILRLAHTLRGSGGTYGFPEVTEAARYVEESTADNLRSALSGLIETLREVVKDVSDEPASILIIDDDPEQAGFIKTMLGGRGREIHIAHTGAEAMAILEKQEISLILLDLILPDTDGRNLLVRIRERLATATVPIIVVSVKSGSQIPVECSALGADGFLEKPLSPEALQSLVAAKLRLGADPSRELRRDPLTGLPNRAAFHEAFERAQVVARLSGTPLNIALVDVDHLDLVNDIFGRPLGDQVLRRVASLLSRALRVPDLLARWGGEEFAVIFPGKSTKEAAESLNAGLSALKSETFGSDPGATLQITFSAGVVPVPAGASLEEAMSEADRHLYLAKQGGLDRVVSAEDKLEAPRRRILLAEDDEMIRIVIRRLLEREGFEVTTCADGSSALRSAYENTYAMILSDVRMPQLDGFELLRRLRELPENERTPVVMLTSMGKDQDVHRGFELGADDYIVKPFSSAELLSRVRRLIKKAS